jgi:hypothetical protein
MMRAVVLVVAALTSRPNGTPSSGVDNSLLSQIHDAAVHKRVAQLRVLDRAVSHSEDETVQNIYRAALYYVNPMGNRDRFASHFPVDTRGVMYDMSYRLPSIVPVDHGWAFRELAVIAERGNLKAASNMLLAFSASDGGPGELIGDALSDLSNRNPSIVLRALAALPASPRSKIIDNAYPWCDSASSIRRVRTEDQRIREIQLKIQSTVSRCKP